MFFQLNQLKNSRFTGSLLLKNGKSWSCQLYFRLGRIMWATGGPYPHLRWQRHLAVFCPELTGKKLAQIASGAKTQPEYEILIQLHQQASCLQKQKLINLVTSIVSEILFDLIQYGAVGQKKFSYRTIANDKPGPLLTLIDTEIACQQVQIAWQHWVSAELRDYSPNLFPVIEKVELLQEQLKPHLERQLISLVDGTQNLRSLALICARDVLSLTKLLLPFKDTGAISFSPVPHLRKFDLKPLETKKSLSWPNSDGLIISPSLSETFEPHNSTPLVACVDDSLLICRGLEQIITRQGYRFIGIRDSLKALAILLSTSPDLIFLDLSMPSLNGYELGAQLRKVPSFKEIPIVILTGQEGLVARSKAKLVGATAFLSKPLSKEEIWETVAKYLSSVSE
ncbi:MAG: response regulator [Prochloraceae cyanobacterium]